MSLFDRRTELKELILLAVSSVIRRLAEKHQAKDVYALVFYPSSGYRSLGIAYASRTSQLAKPKKSDLSLSPDLLEMLKDHPDLLRLASRQSVPNLYYEVNACEWDGANAHNDLFSRLNDVITLGYDALYEEGVDNSQICHFFETLLTEALSELKSSEILKSSVFEDDVLLGVQFADTDNPETVKRISKAINSANWHDKVCAGYGNDR